MTPQKKKKKKQKTTVRVAEVFFEKDAKVASHSLRGKNVKLSQLDIMLLEVTKTKQDSKYFLLSWLTSSQIWLNPLVHDGQSATSQD
jgi:hypothetical protein